MSMMIRRHKAKRESSVVPAPKEVTAYSGGEKSQPETNKEVKDDIPGEQGEPEETKDDIPEAQDKPKRGRPSKK